MSKIQQCRVILLIDGKPRQGATVYGAAARSVEEAVKMLQRGAAPLCLADDFEKIKELWEESNGVQRNGNP